MEIRGGENLFERDALLRGDALAIFVFGSGVEDCAIEAGDFHTDGAEGSLDGHGFAIQSLAMDFVSADADGGGLVKNEIDEAAAIGNFAKNGDELARAIFFHLHGRGKNIEGSGGESAFDEIAIDLRAHVVEIGFDDGDDGFGTRRRGLLREGFADENAEDVGLFGEIGGASAVADGSELHRKHFAEG